MNRPGTVNVCLNRKLWIESTNLKGWIKTLKMVGPWTAVTA